MQTANLYLLMNQAICDLIFSLSHNLLFYNPPADKTFFCNLQGYLINFSVLSSVLFSAVISGHMLLLIKKKQMIHFQYNLTNMLVLKVSGVIVVLAASIASIPFSTNQFTNLGSKCWVGEDENGRDRNDGVFQRFFLFFLVSDCDYSTGMLQYMYIRIFGYGRMLCDVTLINLIQCYVILFLVVIKF
jgi:hypothetical protein